MSILFFDTETTGLDFEKDEIIELSFRIYSAAGVPLTDNISTLVYADTVSEESSKIHNIYQKDLIGKPTMDKVVSVLENNYKRHNVNHLVAHNINFDTRMLGKYLNEDSILFDAHLIDTLLLSRRLIKDVDNHKLETLARHLNLVTDTGEFHSAAYDVDMLVKLFFYMFDGDIASLVEYVDTPIRLAIMPFGKHKGQKLGELPCKYIEWLRTLDGLDIDMRHTLQLL